jgi:hypothetical protein
MINKRLVLAASMMVFIAMAGQAYAGTTISDTRYWPGEARSAAHGAVRSPENAFASVETPQRIEATRPSYHGGPKVND